MVVRWWAWPRLGARPALVVASVWSRPHCFFMTIAYVSARRLGRECRDVRQAEEATLLRAAAEPAALVDLAS